jgi:hypothetical protein
MNTRARPINSRAKGANGEREFSRVVFEHLGVSLVSIWTAAGSRRLIEDQGGGSLLGDFGDTATDLIEELRQRYGNRLESVSQ